MLNKLLIFLSVSSLLLMAADGGYSNKKFNQQMYGELRGYELYSIQDELRRANYQEQFIKLNNLVMDIDTDNKVLKEQVKIQKEYFVTAMSEQKERYEVELEQQTLIYAIALGGLTILGFILSWFGYKQLKLYINGTVKNEHNNAILEISELLSNDVKLQKRIETLVKIELEKQAKPGQSFEDDVS